MSSAELKAAFALAATYFLRMLGLFMITPIFALHAEHLAGATPRLVGIAVGIYGLTQALFQIPFGTLSDRLGRKPVITVGLLIFALGSIVAAFSESITWIIIGRALQGTGAVGSATMALAADVIREEQRVKGMAIIGISIGLAFPLAFIAGPSISGHFGMANVFILSAVLGLLAIAILYLFVPQTQDQHFHRECEYVPSQFWDIIKNQQLLRLDYGVLTLHFILTATFVVLPLVLRDIGQLAPAQHWKIYLPTLIISIVALGPMFRFSEKSGYLKQIFCLSVGILAISQTGFYLNNQAIFWVEIMLVLFFTAINFLEASLPSLISRVAPADRRGTAMGIYSTSQFMGIFLGGLSAGILHQQHGISAVFLLNASIALLWLVISLSMTQPRNLRTRIMRLNNITEEQASQLKYDLLNIPGVVEAEMIAAEQTGYLKIDVHMLDEDKLNQLL